MNKKTVIKLAVLLLCLGVIASFVVLQLGSVGTRADGVFYCDDFDIKSGICSALNVGYNKIFEGLINYGTWHGVFAVWPMDIVCSNRNTQEIDVRVDVPAGSYWTYDPYGSPKDEIQVPAQTFYEHGEPHLPVTWSGYSGELQFFGVRTPLNSELPGIYHFQVTYYDCNGAIMDVVNYEYYYNYEPPVEPPVELAFNPDLPYDLSCEDGTLTQYSEEFSKWYSYSVADMSVPYKLSVTTEQWEELCPTIPPVEETGFNIIAAIVFLAVIVIILLLILRRLG